MALLVLVRLNVAVVNNETGYKERGNARNKSEFLNSGHNNVKLGQITRLDARKVIVYVCR